MLPTEAPPIEISSKEDLQELARQLKAIAEKKPFSEMDGPKIGGKRGKPTIKVNLDSITPNKCLLAYKGERIALICTLDDLPSRSFWHVSLSLTEGTCEPLPGEPVSIEFLREEAKGKIGRISDALASEILEVFFGEAECRELNVNVLFKNVRHFFCPYK